MSSTVAHHRVGLTTVVALAALFVIGGLVLAGPRVERLIGRLPDVPATAAAFALIGVVAIAVVVGLIVRAASGTRTRSRRLALEAATHTQVSCGIRNHDLVTGLAELRHRDQKAVALGARFSVVADDIGLSFWAGGRRPRRAALFAWREVRSIRADSAVVGSGSVPLVIVRVRRGGASVELPVMLSAARATHFALADAPFYALVREWKAKHRAALAAEGLELPPLTAPIQIIRQHAA